MLTLELILVFNPEKLRERLLRYMDRIRSILISFLNGKACTKQELLSLLGHFNFASQVIYHKRAFVSYLLTLSTTVKALNHDVKLTTESRLDIKVWALFLEHWNAVSFFLDNKEINADDIQFFTDAIPKGFGGYFQGK